MLSKEERKRAAAAFKEQKQPAGIYAIRCIPLGRVWVGSSRNLNAARNGTWFSLRIEAHRDAALQAEWITHGEPAFAFEILETLPDDVPALSVADLLKERRDHWRTTLDAAPLL